MKQRIYTKVTLSLEEISSGAKKLCDTKFLYNKYKLNNNINTTT